MSADYIDYEEGLRIYAHGEGEDRWYFVDDNGATYPVSRVAFNAIAKLEAERQGPIPLYAMLDVWMALRGTSHPEFDQFYDEHGYADTWAILCAEVRDRRQGPITDAQVEAADAMYDRLIGLPEVDRMRAALEAARSEP